jgi:N6-adenosine-specific RNA methylase IME4
VLYRTILADPPWKQQMSGNYNVTRHKRPGTLQYETMSLKEICALNVAELAADDCHLWLWTTNQFLDEGFDVMRSWGFKYLAPIHWIKPSGLGNYFIHRTQTCLFGYRRFCKFEKSRYLPNIIEAPARAHSAKPEATYSFIESISAAPRIELFARPWTPLFQGRIGWHVWGNEVQCDTEVTTKKG